MRKGCGSASALLPSQRRASQNASRANHGCTGENWPATEFHRRYLLLDLCQHGHPLVN